MRRDETYLLDILIAAQDARRFVANITRLQFDESRLHQSAVAKALEVIGEAAARTSDEMRQAHPDIPWCARHPVGAGLIASGCRSAGAPLGYSRRATRGSWKTCPYCTWVATA